MRDRSLRKLSAAVVVFALAPSASADPATARLDWKVASGVEGCPDSAEFATLARERMGREVFQGETGEVVSIRVDRAPQGLQGTIELRSGSGSELGRREIVAEGPSCQNLVDHLVLVASLMLDYAQNGPAPHPAPIRVPPQEAPGLRWQAAAVFEAGTGMLPGGGLGGGVDVGVLLPPAWSFELSGYVFFNRDIEGVDQEISSYALRVAICPFAVTPGPTRLKFCASQQTARLVVHDTVFPPGRTQEQLSAAVGPRVRLDVLPRPPLLLSLALGVEFPLTRVRFTDVGPAGGPVETYEASGIFGYAALLVGFEGP
jgi:hypothetical protein